MYIKCKFIDADGNPKGREYLFGMSGLVNVNSTVYTSDGKELIVTATDLPREFGEQYGDKLKYVTLANPMESPLEVEVPCKAVSQALETLESKAYNDICAIVDEPEPSTEIAMSELSVDVNSVIVIKQLPMITEQLKAVSAEIDTQISNVLSLACTPETKSTIKKHRASLNTIYKDLESRRIAVKKQILAPYDEFDAIYKECVTNKFNAAFATLDERTGMIDGAIKNELSSDVMEYFTEYALCEGVEWLTWAQANISVGLSSNKTALRRAAKEFVDRVVQDIAMIETQDEAAEMMVEYRQTLNAAQAIKTVKDRIAAVERQKEIQHERFAAEREEAQRLKAMISAAPITVASAPVPIVERDIPADFLQPCVHIQPADTKFTVAFKATASQEKLKALVQYLKDNGIEYKQVPVKNIMEVSDYD